MKYFHQSFPSYGHEPRYLLHYHKEGRFGVKRLTGLPDKPDQYSCFQIGSYKAQRRDFAQDENKQKTMRHWESPRDAV